MTGDLLSQMWGEVPRGDLTGDYTTTAERPEADVSPDAPDSWTEQREPASGATPSVRYLPPDVHRTEPRLAHVDILGEFRKDLHRAGVAGEERLAQLVYLALTSRMLPWDFAERPVSILAKGTSATGKSHTVRTVLRFFPESAWLNLGSMSRRFLFYTEDEFSHRFIVVPEYASIKDDEEIVAMLRVLLSEGRIVHGTVEGEGKRKATRIEKPGPTGLLITTTEAAVDSELETRCLSVLTDDTPEQTRRVYDKIAEYELEATHADLARWHELQEWIADRGETRVAVPFVAALAALMPTGAARLRRDYVSLLCLVRAHALLHQAQRERDELGRVTATVEGDYAPVRAFVGDVIAEGVEASVSLVMRETVEAVQVLLDEGKLHVSQKQLADQLGIGRSATYDRIRRALLAGYLVNDAGKDERGQKLVVGAALPSAATFLPSSEALVRWASGEGIRTDEPAPDAASEGVVRSSGPSGVPPEGASEDAFWESLTTLWRNAALATGSLVPRAILQPGIARLLDCRVST
jgi:hypothetical protein